MPDGLREGKPEGRAITQRDITDVREGLCLGDWEDGGGDIYKSTKTGRGSGCGGKMTCFIMRSLKCLWDIVELSRR